MFGLNFSLIFFIILLGIIFYRYVRVVPQRQAYIVERLGKYHSTLQAGLHFLIPFIDKVAYIHSLKEQAIDVPTQICITRDNISVEVDGILYMQVMDPHKASYGINNYMFAVTQLAQTTMRSIIGKLDLDQTFEERDNMNNQIVMAVDKASDPWGVKITRYEIKDIKPPQSINDAMEKQMRAEREKRATIAQSEGEKVSRINIAEGEKAAVIAASEAEMQRQINEATGKASEIEQLAKATGQGIREIAAAIQEKGGLDAVNLRVAEQYIQEFGNLAKESNTMILPSNLSDIAGVVSTAMKVVQDSRLSR